MLLTLLAPEQIMLVIIITENTDEQVIKDMRVILIKQEVLQDLQDLQELPELPEPMVLQELPELPEPMVLRALTEQMGQQQLVPMVSQVEVEESLS
jgi:hypothetical protein